MEYIELGKILQPGQEYVSEVAGKLGIDVRAVRHYTATDTCFEKAALLGWDADKVIKMHLFSNSHIYGFVFPELGDRQNPKALSKKRIARAVGCTNKQAKEFRNSYYANGMEFGTCTPFVLEDSFEKKQDEDRLDRIYIHDVPRLNESLVDISIGGFGEEAHKTSLHLLYHGIYDILREKFGDKIQRVNLFT